MTAQRLLTFAGLFLAAWAVPGLVACGWCLAARLHAANMRRIDREWGTP